ncbi:ChaC-like protein [compost metagenome]
MNPQHPLFEEDTSHQVIAPLIASASGPLGTNAQYLFSLDNELKNHGMQDDCIGDLVSYVQQWLQQNTSGPIGGEATA